MYRSEELDQDAASAALQEMPFEAFPFVITSKAMNGFMQTLKCR